MVDNTRRNISIALASHDCMALRRFANELGEPIEEAAAIALRDWLIGCGYLEVALELDEDTETEGKA